MCDVRKQYGYCDWGLPHCRKCEEHLNEDHEQYARQNPICDRCLLSDIQEEVKNQVEWHGLSCGNLVAPACQMIADTFCY